MKADNLKHTLMGVIGIVVICALPVAARMVDIARSYPTRQDTIEMLAPVVASRDDHERRLRQLELQQAEVTVMLRSQTEILTDVKADVKAMLKDLQVRGGTQ